ncbi:hypothetical protein SAMN05421504_103862 [Amycolatopsis xylanica]|uniref:Allene oxide cyclase barrel-like domain-containing protein n=1 Tax=Amycolatopsis xylanica TaxID=589385 RepID=A0A1H3EMM2_9PSEU|nr:hypothetical protein [Amycolatopsis xylanica]SDX79179.1 hypothetical protein SAMN05421504_103862 [Amycolatopsis xylanica]
MKNRYSKAILCSALLMAILPGAADALSVKRFTVASDPGTAVVDFGGITTPPLPGQPLTIRENLRDLDGGPAGLAAIDCVVVAFTTADLVLDCRAHFELLDGAIDGHAVFMTSQHDYPAVVLGGTEAYQGVLGTVRVLDRAPGDETYVFSLLAT